MEARAARSERENLTAIYTSVQREILGEHQTRRIGNYEIIRKIAAGSFSTVYLAVHVFTRLEVVLKSVKKSQPNLVSEIANLRTFKHPHIIQLYEIIVMPEEVWLALEYCPGEELFAHLVRYGAYREQSALRIFSQICGAVAYAHSRSIAHRDIKLENIMFDEYHNVKLGDFGFTRNYASKSMLETICGTGPYMAPELFNRKKYNPEATDVWALGVILYALVYGQLPFDEDSDAMTRSKIMSEEPDYPAGVVSSQVEDLVRELLQKDPKSRPKTVQILSRPALVDEFGAHQLDILAAPIPVLFSTKREKRALKAMSALSMDLKTVVQSLQNYSCDPIYGFWLTSLDKQRHDEMNSTLTRSKSDARSLKSVARVARKIVRSPDPRALRKSLSVESSLFHSSSSYSQTASPQPKSTAASQLNAFSFQTPDSPSVTPSIRSGRLPTLPDEGEGLSPEPLSPLQTSRTVASQRRRLDVGTFKPGQGSSEAQNLSFQMSKLSVEPTPSKPRSRDRFKTFLGALRGKKTETGLQAVEEQSISNSTQSSRRDSIPKTPPGTNDEEAQPEYLVIADADMEEDSTRRASVISRPISQISSYSQISQLSQISENSKDSVSLNALLGRSPRRSSAGSTLDDIAPDTSKLGRKPSLPFLKKERPQTRKRMEAEIIEEGDE